VRIEAISNGLGAQSMYLCWLAGRGRLPARLSISADTGSEKDCLWASGERTTLREYFDQVALPLCGEWGIEAVFVRSRDKDDLDMPSIEDFVGENAPDATSIPLFGSNGGRLVQSCTDRWKARAIRQEGRRRGADHMRTAQGIHYGEAARRVKGLYVGKVDGFDTYHDTAKVKDANGNSVIKTVKWLTHYYPLVDLRMNRDDVRREMQRLDIPYLISTECDICPHKDAARWLRTSPETIQRAANLESRYNGTQFLTDRRRPLLTVIEEYKTEARMNPKLFDDSAFDCTDGLCGV
jgi:hypothetical protein